MMMMISDDSHGDPMHTPWLTYAVGFSSRARGHRYDLPTPRHSVKSNLRPLRKWLWAQRGNADLPRCDCDAKAFLTHSSSSQTIEDCGDQTTYGIERRDFRRMEDATILSTEVRLRSCWHRLRSSRCVLLHRNQHGACARLRWKCCLFFLMHISRRVSACLQPRKPKKIAVVSG